MDFIFGMDNSVIFAIFIIIGSSLFILWTFLNYLNNKLILNQTNNQNQNQTHQSLEKQVFLLQEQSKKAKPSKKNY